MKRPSNKTTRLIVWTLSSNIIASSCTNGDLFVDEDSRNIYEHVLDMKDAIHVSLTSKQCEYLEHLYELSDKIINDREFAKCFSINPSTYLSQFRICVDEEQGKDGINVMQDEMLYKIVNAFADDEIAMAIKENDVKRYLLLMHKKGYLDTSSNVNDYNNLLSIEEKEKLLNDIGLNGYSTEEVERLAVAAVVALFYAAVAVVSWAAVTYTVLGFMNAATTATVLTYAGAVTKTKVKTSGAAYNVELSPNFDVYLLSASSKDKEITFGSENLNKTIHDIVDAYSEIFREDTKDIDIEALEQLLKLNLSKQEIISNNTIILERDK